MRIRIPPASWALSVPALIAAASLGGCGGAAHTATRHSARVASAPRAASIPVFAMPAIKAKPKPKKKPRPHPAATTKVPTTRGTTITHASAPISHPTTTSTHPATSTHPTPTTAPPRTTTTSPGGTHCIPQGKRAGDEDADNKGGPNDGDGCV